LKWEKSRQVKLLTNLKRIGMRRFNFIESPYTGARVRITSKNKKIGKTMKQDSKKNKRQNKMQVIDKTAILKHKIELRLRR